MGPALSHSELRSVQFQGDSGSVTASSVDVPKARVMDSKEDPKKINAILPQIDRLFSISSVSHSAIKEPLFSNTIHWSEKSGHQ